MNISPSHSRMSQVFKWIREPYIRLLILVVLHFLLFALIYAFAFFARFNFGPSESNVGIFWSTIGPVVITKLLVFYFGGHFHGWWRYVTFRDLQALLRVSLFSMCFVAFVDYFILAFDTAIPRLSILLDALVTIVVIGGLRSTWRFADEMMGNKRGRGRSPALLIGTDHLTGRLASQINSNDAMKTRVVGFLAKQQGYRKAAKLGGIAVLGCVTDVMRVASREGIKEILVPAGSLGGAELRRLNRDCNTEGLSVRVLPRFEDAMAGSSEIPLRSLNIEDLLRRDPVELDAAEVKTLLQGKRVLVTGAGGSIGSEICRQVLEYDPSDLILLGRGENRIHAVWQEFVRCEKEFKSTLHVEIADITDEPRMEKLFAQYKPEIVFHAAAHKHVPLMEMHPCEAIKNNVFGTRVLASLADQNGVSHFVMVSTDKAVNPTSIMGCSKQLAERVVFEQAQASECRFSTVRFGNVLGSAGSVIPIFQEQIRRGGPITVTDERMTRYFMSIPEASQLVIQAATQCKGGEIFVLDMGEPVKIVQLAEDLITLSGLPRESIEIVFSGIRPGEKLYEELYFDEEATLETVHPKVRAAYATDFEMENVSSEIDALIANAFENSPNIRELILQLVPSFHGEQPTTKDEDKSRKVIPST